MKSGSEFVAISSVVGAAVVLYLFRRQSRGEARILENGNGAVLLFPVFTRYLGWACLVLALALLIWLIYGLVLEGRDASRALIGVVVFFGALLCGFIGWPCLWLIRKARERIELTDEGIAQLRGAVRVFIPWTDVCDVSEQAFPNLLLFRGADGLVVKVDRMLTGTATLVDYLRTRLSPEMYLSARRYLER